jgi:prepilin-type N-terminal cleavage/methylation domain-containing protein
MLKLINSRFKLKNQKGISLVEVMVALAILGTAVAAFVIALSTGSLTITEQNKETTSQSLAQTQMEYTKNYTYAVGAVTYPVLPPPATYSVTIGVMAVPGADTNIQKITVTVFKESKNVLTVTDYKVNR